MTVWMRVLIWAAVGGAAGLLGASCQRDQAVVHYPLRAANVEIAILEAGDVEPLAGVRAGDWLLRTPELMLAVAGTRETPEQALRFGSIVGIAASKAAGESPLELRTVASTASGENILLSVSGVTAQMREGKPELLIAHRARGGELNLETYLKAEPGSQWIRLETRIWNRSKSKTLRVRVGDEIEWPGRAAFAPGLGDIQQPGTGEAAWVARESGPLTYGLAFPQGRAALDFTVDHVGPSGVLAWSRIIEVPPNDSQVHSRLLLASVGSLAEAARILWPLAGVEVGELRGKISTMPTWARIEVRDPSGQLIIRTIPEPTGQWRLPVPPGQYRIALQAPGGTDERGETLEAPGQQRSVELIAPEAGRLHFVTNDESGQAIPARWMFFGIPPTSNPKLAPSALGENNVVFSKSGFGSIELPPGAYNVRSSRGPEFSVHEQKIVIDAARGATVRAQLRREVDTKGWLPCDFHLHASPSFDSEVTLEQRVVSLLTEGVMFAAATDHNVVTDYASVMERLEIKSGFSSVPGVEITTRTWGHFNVFPYGHADPPVHADIAPSAIFKNVRGSAPDALIQVNHPRLWDIGYFGLGGLDPLTGNAVREGFSFDFDTIELFNGFDLNQLSRLQSNLIEWFHLLNNGHRFTAVGNSDSHRLSEQWAGYPRTYVAVDEGATVPLAESVSKALKGGRAMVTNGPFLQVRINGASIGDLVEARNGRAEIEVEVSAPAWMSVDRIDIVANGELREERRIVPSKPAQGAPLRWRATLNLPVDRDTWVVVGARGQEPLEPLLPGVGALPVAFTNPIYVDADGDGQFTPPARAMVVGADR